MTTAVVSEIFKSFQGEGALAGRLSIWVRFGGCNLKCGGFWQKDPADKTTWIDPVQKYNLLSYTDINKMPVVEYGCDSIYSIDPRFKKLWKKMTVDEMSSSIDNLLPTIDGSHEPLWLHPTTRNNYDLCFTGGEPMLHQDFIVEYLSLFGDVPLEDMFEGVGPSMIQFETNGTKPPTRIINYVDNLVSGKYSPAFYFNISPKLFYVSGEANAWDINNIADICMNFASSLKVVINNDDRAWKELDENIKRLKDRLYYTGGFMPQVFIMPVGATKEQQEDSKVIGDIARRAIDSGYNISGRTHCIVFGNTAGV